MGENKLSVFEKSMLGLALTVPTEEGPTNALFNMLGDTSYFTFENNKLVFNDNYDIEKLMECCNTKYLGQNGLLDAKRELNDSDSYIKYITYENPKLDDAINLNIDNYEHSIDTVKRVNKNIKYIAKVTYNYFKDIDQGINDGANYNAKFNIDNVRECK